MRSRSISAALASHDRSQAHVDLYSTRSELTEVSGRARPRRQLAARLACSTTPTPLSRHLHLLHRI